MDELLAQFRQGKCLLLYHSMQRLYFEVFKTTIKTYAKLTIHFHLTEQEFFINPLRLLETLSKNENCNVCITQYSHSGNFFTTKIKVHFERFIVTEPLNHVAADRAAQMAYDYLKSLASQITDRPETYSKRPRAIPDTNRKASNLHGKKSPPLDKAEIQKEQQLFTDTYTRLIQGVDGNIEPVPIIADSMYFCLIPHLL